MPHSITFFQIASAHAGMHRCITALLTLPHCMSRPSWLRLSAQLLLSMFALLVRSTCTHLLMQAWQLCAGTSDSTHTRKNKDRALYSYSPWSLSMPMLRITQRPRHHRQRLQPWPSSPLQALPIVVPVKHHVILPKHFSYLHPICCLKIFIPFTLYT